MSEDNNTPRPTDPTPPAESNGEEQAESRPQDTGDAATTDAAAAKPKLSDEEKAAKVAAAKAKAAARAAEKAKESDQPAEPKPPWEEKPVPPEHADAGDDPDVQALAAALPEAVLGADRYADEVTVTVPAERIVEVCRHLKEEGGFHFLVDVTAVDWPEREDGRFDVLYWMHRHSDSRRLRLRTVLSDGDGIASVTGVWRTANWLEREVYDMFGILFEGHPALERILTWEGFNGHPLRKDFPVEGIDTGAAVYPDVYPPGAGPVGGAEDSKEASK